MRLGLCSAGSAAAPSRASSAVFDPLVSTPSPPLPQAATSSCSWPCSPSTLERCTTKCSQWVSGLPPSSLLYRSFTPCSLNPACAVRLAAGHPSSLPLQSLSLGRMGTWRQNSPFDVPHGSWPELLSRYLLGRHVLYLHTSLGAALQPAPPSHACLQSPPSSAARALPAPPTRG